MGRVPCCDKNNNDLKKGPWTPEEDLKLTNYIETHGPGNWRTLPKNAGLQRCGKSCRLRWTNYLRPDIKRGRFSFEEEETIIQLHSILGNKWSAIAARLPGRTDNEIKNYWNTHIRKRLLRMGIDPITHAPRLDLLDMSSILRSVLENPSLLNLQALMNPDLLNLAATASLLSLNNNNDNLAHNNNHNNNSNILQEEIIQGGDCHVQNQVATSQGPIGQFLTPTEFATNVEGLSSQQNYQFGNVLGSEGNSVHSLMNNGDQNYLGYDSVLSSPNQMNSSSTEEERDSYCGDLFKFEIPESLDISDFL